MNDVLSRRALNRATLARQLLLERAPMTAYEAIEHLGGMQSQAPLAPYVGLWTRLEGFTPDALAALTEERDVVRLPLMRSTVHVVSARDALAWRPLFDHLHATRFRASFGRDIEGTDLAGLVDEATRLMDERPRTRAELGALLAASRTDAEPNTLAYAATHNVATCQVPPRGVWGATGAPTWAVLETWLGAPMVAASVDALVLRYLGAFGPAQVADVQAWCGLTRLREVVEALPLRTFAGPQGEMLYDLPEAPRPPEDTPAPARLLPEYDNLLLSHKDRTRVNPEGRAVPLPPGNGATGGTFLVDGTWAGTWRNTSGSLHLAPFATLRRNDRAGLLAEAGRLRAWLSPQDPDRVVLDGPAGT